MHTWAAGAPVPPQQDSPIALEIAYWQSAQASNNAADLDAYLKRYPQGQFADLAHNRQSIRMPDSLTTLLHLTSSSLMNAPNCSGVVVTISKL